MINYWIDTESIQFIGATMLLQYSKSESTNLGDIILWSPFDEQAGKTKELIENMINSRFVGFNLTHDIFHISRLYNLLSYFSYSERPKEHLDFFIECYNKPVKYCLLPKNAVDLMLIGQRNQFQGLVRQKPIRIKKIPKLLAEKLIFHLEKEIKLNPLYFAGFKQGRHWQINKIWASHMNELAFQEIGGAKIKNKNDIHPDLVNLVLPFKPKKRLKDIMKYLLNKDVKYFESYCKKYKEKFWNPLSSDWLDVYQENYNMWKHDPNQIQYAKDDVLYTYEFDKYLGFPNEDTDSLLACMSGNQYHKGYTIDKEKAKKLLVNVNKKYLEAMSKVDVKAPRACLKYLREGVSDFLQDEITDTKASTLVSIIKNSELPNLREKVKLIIQGRNAGKRKILLERLIKMNKLYAQFKIGGTATNRKSGGNDEVQNAGISGKSESISAHGLPREKIFREIFTFNKEPNWTLSGGDAKGFEVAIAAAVFNDKTLTKTLREGKSFHGLFGASVYKMTYEEVIKNLVLYTNAKTGVFAWFFGALAFTIAQNLNLSIEEVEEGIEELEKTYPGIKKNREKIWNKFQALRQPNGLGTQVIWNEPDTFIETFMGLKRDFTVEIETMRALFNLSQHLPDDLKKLNIKVTRNLEKGIQKGWGAVMSALFAAAFSIQSQIMKIASNFVIQSPGAEMIKELEYNIINKFQPRGINEYNIMTFNAHDELQIPHKIGLEDLIEKEVRNFEKEYRKKVPLFEMEWKKRKSNWAETH
ncbi:MAG: DNA polymerase [Candidatus Helarchaeota archaeon]